MSDHDLVCPPSSAYRWLKCHRSALLNSRRKDAIVNPMRDFGSECHEIMRQYFDHMCGIADMPTVPDDKREAIDCAVQLLHSKTNIDEIPDYEDVYAEDEVDLLDLGIENGTVDLMWMVSNNLHILDYKFGYNAVEIDTPQLPIYAIGALKRYALAETVTVHIIAPNFYPHYQERIYNIDELTAFAAVVKDAVKRCHEPIADAAAGEHCQYCKAIDTCGEVARHKAEIAVLNPKTVVDMLRSCSPAQATDFMSKLDAVEMWCDSVRKMISAAGMAGEISVPGYGQVPGRRSREWSDEKDVVRQFGDQCLTVMTPSQAEKILGKEAVNALTVWRDGTPKYGKLKGKK